MFILSVLVMSCNHRYLNSTSRVYPTALVEAIALAALESVQTRTCAPKPEPLNIDCIPGSAEAPEMTT